MGQFSCLEAMDPQGGVSDEIHAMLADHALVHGLSMRGSGQRVQLIGSFTVASIIWTFREENR